MSLHLPREFQATGSTRVDHMLDMLVVTPVPCSYGRGLKSVSVAATVKHSMFCSEGVVQRPSYWVGSMSVETGRSSIE